MCSRALLGRLHKRICTYLRLTEDHKDETLTNASVAWPSAQTHKHNLRYMSKAIKLYTPKKNVFEQKENEFYRVEVAKNVNEWGFFA